MTVQRDLQPEALLHSRVPVMLVQTLVENAIKHGIAPLEVGGVLVLRAWTLDREVLIEVTNPRPVEPVGRAPADGVGLSNARARLELLFDSATNLQLDFSDPQQAVARVRLPR